MRRGWEETSISRSTASTTRRIQRVYAKGRPRRRPRRGRLWRPLERALDGLEEARGLSADVPVADAAEAVRPGARGLLAERLRVVPVLHPRGGHAVEAAA